MSCESIGVGNFNSYLDIKLKVHSVATPLSFQPGFLFNYWMASVSSVGVSNCCPSSKLRMLLKKPSHTLILSACL